MNLAAVKAARGYGGNAYAVASRGFLFTGGQIDRTPRKRPKGTISIVRFSGTIERR